MAAAPSTRRISRKAGLAIVGVAILLAGQFAYRPALLRLRIYQAQRALEHRDYEQALDLLQSNARMVPDDAETQFWLARTFRKLGQFDQVRECLLRAQELGYPVDRLEREQWLTLAQAGQMPQAALHLQELLLSATEDEGPEICEAYVHGYCLNLDFQMASVLLETWQTEYPNDPEPYFRRGYLRQSVLDEAGAAENYRRGLELDPDRADARLRLAEALLQLNQLEESEQQFSRLLTEHPDDDDVEVGLARCLKQRGELQHARQLLTRVVTRSPDNLDAGMELGLLAVEEADYDDAVRWLEPLYHEDPFNSAVLLGLAQAQQGRGRLEQSRKLSEELEVAEQMSKRLAELIESALKNPQDLHICFEIGELLRQTRAYEDAAKWLRRVVALNPDHLDAHRGLALCYRETGHDVLEEQHRSRAEQLRAADQ